MAFRTQRDLDRLTLPAGKTEVFSFDARCPGLSVRIQRTGKPAFVVWYTAPSGKRKRLTLGPVAGLDSMTLGARPPRPSMLLATGAIPRWNASRRVWPRPKCSGSAI